MEVRIQAWGTRVPCMGSPSQVLPRQQEAEEAGVLPCFCGLGFSQQIWGAGSTPSLPPAPSEMLGGRLWVSSCWCCLYCIRSHSGLITLVSLQPGLAQHPRNKVSGSLMYKQKNNNNDS